MTDKLLKRSYSECILDFNNQQISIIEPEISLTGTNIQLFLIITAPMM